MPGFTQFNFSGGVVAKSLFSRKEQQRYQAGLAAARNWIISRFGSLLRRPGTMFLTMVKDADNPPRLARFEFNPTDTYQLEIGDSYIRFLRNDTMLLHGATDAWITATEYEAGALVTNGGSAYWSRAQQTSDASTEPGDGADWEDLWYLQPATGELEVPTPYTHDEVHGNNGERPLRWKEINDRVYFVHPNHPPAALDRLGATQWRFENIEFTPTTPRPTDITLTPQGGIAGAARIWRYKLTGVDDETGRESLASLGPEIGAIDGIVLLVADTSYADLNLDGVVASGLADGDTIVIDASRIQSSFQTDTENELAALLDNNEYVVDLTSNPPFVRIDLDWSSLGLTSNAFILEETPVPGGGNSATYGHFAYHEISVKNTITNDERVLIEWTKPPGVDEVYVYRDDQESDVYGFVGSARGESFADYDVTPEYDETPPIFSNPFKVPGDYPAIVDIYKERLVLGASQEEPNRLRFSRVGAFDDFGNRSPLVDDDAFSITIDGGAQEIVGVSNIGPALVVHTDRHEVVVRGDADGFLTFASVTQSIDSAEGSARIEPLLVGRTSLFVQRRGALLLDIRYALEAEGYEASDLTAFSGEIIDGRKIVALAYQRAPNSTVWAVLNDGTMLSLTLVSRQEIEAFATHDTRGVKTQGLKTLNSEPLARDSILDVSTGSGDLQDDVFTVVRRNIAGTTVVAIEKLTLSRVGFEDFDIRRDAFYVDYGKTYNGTNDTTDVLVATTVGVGQSFDTGGIVTLTMFNADQSGPPDFAPEFTIGDVDDNLGRRLHFTLDTGEPVEYEIVLTAFVNTTTVRGMLRNIRLNGKLVDSVPGDTQALATDQWVVMIRLMTGLEHLQNAKLAILADGHEIKNKKVSSAQVSLADDNAPFGIVHAGLPIFERVEMLPLAFLIDADSTVAVQKALQGMALRLIDSRGVYVGPLDGRLTQLPENDDPLTLLNGVHETRTRNNNAPDAPAEIRVPGPFPALVTSVTRLTDRFSTSDRK